MEDSLQHHQSNMQEPEVLWKKIDKQTAYFDHLLLVDPHNVHAHSRQHRGEYIVQVYAYLLKHFAKATSALFADLATSISGEDALPLTTTMRLLITSFGNSSSEVCRIAPCLVNNSQATSAALATARRTRRSIFSCSSGYVSIRLSEARIAGTALSVGNSVRATCHGRADSINERQSAAMSATTGS